jgi:hypothetical protein
VQTAFDFLVVLLPPRHVHAEDDVRPRRQPKGRVRDDDRMPGALTFSQSSAVRLGPLAMQTTVRPSQFGRSGRFIPALTPLEQSSVTQRRRLSGSGITASML